MAKPFGTLTAIFLTLLGFAICKAQNISILMYHNVSSSPDQDLSAVKAYFFGNLTFSEFSAKRALYSKTVIVKRDVVGGETRNSDITNELLQSAHSLCNNRQAGYRAASGGCWNGIRTLRCQQWPRVGPGRRKTVIKSCDPNTECTIVMAYNCLSNNVRFPICLPTIQIDKPQTPKEPGKQPDVYEGSWSPIPYRNDDGTYDIFAKAADGQDLAFIYPPLPQTNYFGPSWACVNCHSGTLGMYHESASTFAYTYYSPSS
ncbi:uncharacterized protein K441DRAFT_698167 [Cenococcum geophilum 1.58]|uniref:uncharacterized protein n=1 Tax=Cenococcum geophilum 1.58 TaxID=794803 RepID=UPI00358DDCBA|nr:hypothetical protein K441DRAFT_698167 [Cenococcum geophilum 1.58]